MKIILMIFSALAACFSALMTFFAFMMLNGGGLGRSTTEDVLISGSYTLLNLAVLVSLFIDSNKSKPVFYILGLTDCLCGTAILVLHFTGSGTILLGLIAYAKGALALSYVSRMKTMPPLDYKFNYEDK